MRTKPDKANIFSRYLKGKNCRPFGDGVDLYLTENDRFLPDGMVICDSLKIKRIGVYGVPDLVVEILSPGTIRYERGYKKDTYELAGGHEYWIVEPDSKASEVYLLQNGKFILDNVYSIYPEYLQENLFPCARVSKAYVVKLNGLHLFQHCGPRVRHTVPVLLQRLEIMIFS